MIKMMYKVSQSTGKVQVWRAWTEGPKVNVEFGEEGGKQQLSTFTAEPKNEGKLNATTGPEQALKEVEALYEDRYTNKHYRGSVIEVQELAGDCSIPRKVHNYKDHAHKMPNLRYVSIKKDGSRACVLKGKLLSKIGREEDIKVKRIKDAVELLKDYSFDSEVFAEGLSLQRIRSAWLKPVKTAKEVAKTLSKTNEVYDPNEDAAKLRLHVFDIPVKGVPFKDRIALMQELEVVVNKLELNGVVVFIYPRLMEKLSCTSYRDDVVADGYEGLVYYDPEDMYEFGKRSYSCLKSKPRYDAEALVTGVEKCKNGDGKLLLRACDKLENAEFKAMMKVSRRDGKDYPRDMVSMEELIGQFITFSYEDLSGRGIPTKPVGECLRKCNDKGEPLE